MRNSAATTSTTDAPRTSAACGRSTGRSSGPGRNGLTGGRGGVPSRGRSTRRSCIAIRYCDLGSHVLGPRRRVLPEEPTGVIPRGGICEGGGSTSTTANLHGHEAGNGGYRQGTPKSVCSILSYSAQGAWSHHPANTACPRRRGDRITASRPRILLWMLRIVCGTDIAHLGTLRCSKPIP